VWDNDLLKRKQPQSEGIGFQMEKIFASYSSVGGLIFSIYKELKAVTTGEQVIQPTNGQLILTDTSKNRYQWPKKL
jgi:hypothetical protein